jgi:4-amino-4-deoxy-L-arabinose transferase-like glycosyltransferase
MTLINDKKLSLIIIALLAIIVFINLGTGEIQPWDEGLYAIRAKSILHYHVFWDQTQYSPGGLYSSTYPPLTIWFMSAFMAVFGENGFSVRLFSALCSVLSFIFIYFTAQRIVSRKYAILATVFIAVTLVWDKFSREGMTDIPLTFFFILTFWAVIKLREATDTKKILVPLIIFTIGFTCSLMTKIVISFLPLLFVFLLLYNSGNKKWYLLIASLAAIALASPWYLYMINHYGEPFYKTLFVPHIYTVVETNSPKLGVLYYLNQLLISNPLIIFSFIFFLILFIKGARKYIVQSVDNKFILTSILIWFSLSFVVLSLARTKMLHYSLYMLPPAILISTLFIEKMVVFINSKRIIWILLMLALMLFLWGLDFNLRQDMKLVFTSGKFTIDTLVFLLIAIVLLSLIFFMPKRIIEKFTLNHYIKVVYIFSAALILKILIINMFFLQGHSYGAEKAADIFQHSGENSFVYLYNEATAADSLNPQIAWYTNGVMNHWVKGKTYKPFPIKPGPEMSNQLNNLKSFSEDMVIYYMPEERPVRKEVIDKVRSMFPVVDSCMRYVVFSKNIYKFKQEKF